ncbi:type IV pilus biogenesis protein PilM (plasmid) [Citrobacter sp. OP27]
MVWLLACVMTILMSVVTLSNTHALNTHSAASVSAEQQADQTVAYMSALDDYLYDHPQTDGTVPDSTLPVMPPKNGHHIIQASRVWVWQPDAPGLLWQLEKTSEASALMGKVANGRLIDAIGTDMTVSVPSSIPDGSVVYLN